LNLFASILLSFPIILLNKQALNYLFYQTRQQLSSSTTAARQQLSLSPVSGSTAAAPQAQQLGAAVDVACQQQHGSSSYRCANEYARVEIRARYPQMASEDFWQTYLANCWKEFFPLIYQILWDSK